MAKGFPKLTPRALQSVNDANILVKFTEQAIRAQSAASHPFFILEHSEDLVGGDGKQAQHLLRSGILSEIWTRTGALRQSDWGTDNQKPTRMLARRPCIEKILMDCWQTFDEDNRYQGPFNRQKINKEMLVGRSKGVFKTAATAAWPAALCEMFSRPRTGRQVVRRP